MAEDWKVQVSTKIGPNGVTMVNFRGDTVEEVAAQIDLFNDLSVVIGQQLTAIADAAGAGGAVGAVFPQSQQVQQERTSPAPQAPAAQGPAAHGPVDQFGKPMVHRTGNGAKGPWGGWFGDYPKGDPQGAQVKPIWDKK